MPHHGIVAPRFTAVALLLLGLATSTGAAPVRCDVTGADAVAVAAARDAVHAACDCDGALTAATYRRCVRATLEPLVAGGSLTVSCEREVMRIETRSTCGRPERVVCCQTSRLGVTKGRIVREGRCGPPRGGSACVDEPDFLADACQIEGCTPPPSMCGNWSLDPGEECDPPDGWTCSPTCTLCLPDGCIAPSSCGDGTVAAGESCDPPNGTTCSRSCTSCAPAAPGEILIGCTAGSSVAQASALPDALLVAFSETTPGGVSHVAARRLANDGTPIDASPLAVSTQIPGTWALGGFTEDATSDGSEFYVGYSTFASVFQSYFGGRRVPASGPITTPPEVIRYWTSVGQCRSEPAGPLHLSPLLDGSGFRETHRILYGCQGTIFFETLFGVGDFFSVPPPGNVSAGGAPIVRGASDVAAVWWNVAVSEIAPPVSATFLAASFVEPAPATFVQLSAGVPGVTPALAAVGDTFVVFWAVGNELRAQRFSRAAGAIDPAGGFLVATGAGAIGAIAAAGEGDGVVAVWRESTVSGSAIRAIRVAADGTVPDPTPIEVATSSTGAAIGVAANAAATLVTFTRAEAAGSSVRAVLLGD